MNPRGCLARLALILSLLVFFLTIAFGLYVRKVMNSDFMTDLAHRAEAYPCIGRVHDPKRPTFHPSHYLAFHYEMTPEVRSPPSLGWRLRMMLTASTIAVSTEADEANRLLAALPLGRFDGFDDAALHYAGKRYCVLDAARKQAVLDYFRRTDETRLEQAMRRVPAP